VSSTVTTTRRSPSSTWRASPPRCSRTTAFAVASTVTAMRASGGDAGRVTPKANATAAPLASTTVRASASATPTTELIALSWLLERAGTSVFAAVSDKNPRASPRW
jgi:hypothetical protein